jgi:hypothetical protein
MLINKRLLGITRLMDEAIGGEGGDAGAAAPAAAEAPKTVDYNEFTELKTNYEKTNKNYSELTSLLGGLKPQLELVDKLKGVFTPEQKAARKYESVHMANVTDVAEEAYRNGELTAEEIRALRSEINQLKNVNTQAQYEQAVLQMNEKWIGDVFDTKEDFEGALNKVGNARPDLVQMFEESRTTGVPLTPAYIREVNAELAQIVLAEMLDIDSKVAQSVHAKIARKKALSEGSIMEGDGYAPKTKGNDSFIQVSYT